jgi:hypothetical protein
MPNQYTRKPRTLTDRFWPKVNKHSGLFWNGTECWVWTAATVPPGYGHISIGHATRYAHRLAYEFVHGPIPAAQCVLHHCDNPSCVRIEHLFLGTQTENIRDRDTKGRQCRGERHPFYGIGRSVSGVPRRKRSA